LVVTCSGLVVHSAVVLSEVSIRLASVPVVGEEEAEAADCAARVPSNIRRMSLILRSVPEGNARKALPPWQTALSVLDVPAQVDDSSFQTNSAAASRRPVWIMPLALVSKYAKWPLMTPRNDPLPPAEFRKSQPFELQ